MMDYDDILELLGGFGRYQWILFVLIAFITFQDGLEFQTTLMAMFTPPFSCVVPNTTTSSDNSSEAVQNFSVSADQCSYLLSNGSTHKCEQFEFDKLYFDETIVTEFNLVCDTAYKIPQMQTVYFSGFFVGAIIASFGDKFGRQRILFFFMIWQIAISIAIALIPGLVPQFVLRFMYGFGNSGAYIGFTLLSELTPLRIRGWIGGNYWILWSFGYLTSPLFSYLGRYWRLVKLATTACMSIYIISLFFLPESPRWLLITGQKERAIEIFKRIAKFNKKDIPTSTFEQCYCRKEKTGDIMEFVKYKHLLMMMLAVLFCNWSLVFSYFGIAMDMTLGSSNIFLNIFLMGLVELPAGTLCGILSEKIGRKPSFISLLLITVCCLMSLPFIDLDSNTRWIRLILALVGKLTLTTSFDVISIIRTESFPTSLRNIGASVISVFCIIAILICPQIVALGNYRHYLPNLIYSIQCVVSTIVVFFCLPETKGLPLADTAWEINQLKRGSEQKWKEMILNSKSEVQPMTEIANEDLEKAKQES